MQRLSLTIILLMTAWVSVAPAAENPLVLDVWPGKVPGGQADFKEEELAASPKEAKPVKRLVNVSKPTISVFRPAKQYATGTAVVICPGGGYHHLAFDKEGEEVAAWLNSLGVTGIVLKYRVPARQGQPKHLAPLQDAQRAMSLVRANALAWNLDPHRIGILGFSAGGHLAAVASTNFDQRQYDALDATDQVSCRPDFAVLVYPAYLAAGDRLAPEIRVNSQTPPVFFALAGDDRISVEGSIALCLALRRAKVPAELHVYATGGHGFGLRPGDNPCSTWPQRCEQWLRDVNMLASVAEPNAANEPCLERLSLSKATEYLDAGAHAHEKNCFACHGTFAYLAARPMIHATTATHRQTRQALEAFAARLAVEKLSPRDTPAIRVSEAVMTAAVLAQHDAATQSKLQPATRKALDRIWDLQRADGGWNWVKQNEPPSEVDDHFGVTMAAIGVGTAPDRYVDTPPARQGLDRIRQYLREHPPTTMHQRGMLLLAAGCVEGLLTKEQSMQTIADLFALQQPDGGWAMAGLGDWKRLDGGPLDRTLSDGYGTGFAVYVLRRGGRIAADDPRLHKGVLWLESHQRASGCWFTRSPRKNDELSTYAGTAYAIMALAACKESESQPRSSH